MFSSGEYWEQRYLGGGNSGSGSYGLLAKYKAEILNSLIKEYGVQSIIEWGCGDGNNCLLYDIPSYTGIDVSKTAIDICKHKFNNDIRKTFFCLDELQRVINRKRYDMSISFDVLYHLVEDYVYEEYMHNLFNSADRYVLIYSYDGEIKGTAEHVRYRQFTDYVVTVFPSYKLIRTIHNRYSRTDNECKDPDSTSWCDFYLYERYDKEYACER